MGRECQKTQNNGGHTNCNVPLEPMLVPGISKQSALEIMLEKKVDHLLCRQE